MSENDEERPSRTQQKRDAEALQALGERLLALPEARLAQLPLPEPLRDAVRVGRSLSQRGAGRRQRQYIGRLMRDLDTEALQAALAAMDTQDADERERFHAAERWRERLLADGDSALSAFFDAHPRADRQRLRQLMQSCRAELAAGRPARRQRELFREIRQTLDSAES